MSAPTSRRRTRAAHRFARAFALAGILLAGACAAPPPARPPGDVARPVPIDLAPRCLLIEGLPALADAPGSSARTTAIESQPLPGGAVLTRLATPAPATRVRLFLGFPWPEAERPSAEIAAELLRHADHTAAPAAFRAETDAIGARRHVEVGKRHLWLGLELPVDERDALPGLFRRWLTVRDDAPPAFERARRRARLGRLAADADPHRVAERAFLRAIGRDATRNAAEPVLDAKGVLARMRNRLVPDVRTTALTHAPLDASDVVALFAGADTTLAGEARPAARRPATADGSEQAATSGAARETPALPSRLLVVDRPGAPQVEVLAGYATGDGLDDTDEADNASDPDVPALELLASGLGGNVGGRLFADLRERQGLVYTIHAAQEPDGRFVVSTRARPERVPALLLGIEAHLEALRSTPFLECELARWRRRFEGERARRAGDPAGAMARLRRELDERGRVLDEDGAQAARRALTPMTLQAIASARLAGAPQVVLVGDRARLEAAFAEIAPERVLHDFDPASDD